MTEMQDRLVNLDVAPGFTPAAPVLASDPVGPVTGQTLSEFARASGLARDSSRASAFSWRPIPASTIVIRGRLRHLSRHIGLPHSRASARAAGAALEERASSRTAPPARSRLPMASRSAAPLHARYLRHRSQLPRRLRADLAGLGAARPALGAADDGDLSRREGHARRAAISAQQLSARRGQSVSRLPVGIRLRNLRRKFDAPIGPAPVAAQAARRLYRVAALHLFKIDRRRCYARRPGTQSSASQN